MAGKGKKQGDLLPLQVIRLAQEAEGYMEFGLLERALERTDRLLASTAGRQAGVALRTEILRRLERFDDALLLLEAAAEEFPDEEAIWVNIGWCRKRTGRLEQAIEAMYRLLERLPESPIGHYNLACYLALAGQRERSLGCLKNALGLDPSLRARLGEEEDFSSLRSDPEFQALLGK